MQGRHLFYITPIIPCQYRLINAPWDDRLCLSRAYHPSVPHSPRFLYLTLALNLMGVYTFPLNL